MKKVLVIHGGNVYGSYDDLKAAVEFYPPRYRENYRDWKSHLQDDLDNSLYEVIQPQFPVKNNAQYELWDITMKKVLEQHGQFDIIIGHSLGTSFLMNYIVKNHLEVPHLLLVASALGDDLYSFKPDEDKIHELEKFCSKIDIFHSRDDKIVPFREGEIVASALPNAVFHIFDEYKHFNGPHYSEIIKCITNSKE